MLVSWLPFFPLRPRDVNRLPQHTLCEKPPISSLTRFGGSITIIRWTMASRLARYPPNVPPSRLHYICPLTPRNPNSMVICRRMHTTLFLTPSTFQSTTDHIHEFFAGYPQFQYNPNASFLSEFSRMARALGFDREERDAARQLLRFAMVAQFNTMYGRDANDLSGWQQLCIALGTDPVPDTIPKCREVSSSISVHIE